MSSHTRTYIETDDLAIGTLSCHAYKVLRYLANRADNLGRCFPKQETIHEALGGTGDDRHVHRAINDLIQRGWIAYLRHNQYDSATGRKLPNVYQVNPEYICIAEQHQAEAAMMWARVGKSLSPSDSGVTLTNNNNQHHESDTIKPAPGTNNNNQHTQEQGVSTAAKPKTLRAEKAEKPQRSTEPASQSEALPLLPPSSAPPPNRLPNPASIGHALPDEAREKLAGRLREFGIPMPMARGFVVEYSVLLIEQAYTQTSAALSSGSITKPGGFFRTILQSNLVDPGLPGTAEKERYTTGKYADIIAS